MTKDERESLVIDGTPVNEFNQVIIINCNEGVETICTFKEALNKRMCMLNHWPKPVSLYSKMTAVAVGIISV